MVTVLLGAFSNIHQPDLRDGGETTDDSGVDVLPEVSRGCSVRLRLS